jgi:hypothetical protein
MALIPKINPIESAMESGEVLQIPRPYLGFSGLGNKCKKKIWMDFRWMYRNSVSKRIARIWERGDLEEARVIRDLEAAGMIVTDTQKTLVDNTGHSRGHIDGIVHNVPGAEKTPHLLEIKTMKDSRFKTYKSGKIEVTDPTYWIQMQMYMGFAGLTRCLFIVTNKDTEERSYNRYKFEKSVCEEHTGIAFDILSSEQYPAPPSGWNKFHYNCKMCSAYRYCYLDAPTEINCRTCQHADMIINGKWECSLHDEILSVDMQRIGCKSYTKMEGLK